MADHRYIIPGNFVASICELNQWALDFEGNYQRIIKSIHISKERGATYRMGPELEITGYSCQDHFNEIDTIIHAYEVLTKILDDTSLHGIVIDVGLPVMHDGVKYNARAICYNGELICIRPKTVLANDGMYHEERWFVGWKKSAMADWVVPDVIKRVIKKFTVPIGVCILQFMDVSIGIEMCEELFVPNSLHNLLSMNGAHVICNGSGSHFQIGKVNKRFALVSDASGKTGCTYLYGNLQGCDGSTMYFDGGSFVASMGKIVSMSKRFQINSGVVVLIVVIDINEIRSRRASVVSLCKTSAESPILPKLYVPVEICKDYSHEHHDIPSIDPYNIIAQNNSEIDELIGAPSCYLWDYLLKSGMGGFFVPISGGADSSVVASLVYAMAENFCQALQKANQEERSELLKSIQQIVNDSTFIPTEPKQICNRILFTCYMGSQNSTEITRLRAHKLSEFLNSNHFEVDINEIYNAYINTVKKAFKVNPKYIVENGSVIEDTALQNVQSRSRMVLSYVISQLIPIIKPKTKSILVLGTSNADEIAAGYFSKYDCSSADISPISSLGKNHIRKILMHFHQVYAQDVFKEIAFAKPTAELVPRTNCSSTPQSDEIDMGFTYNELVRLRELRSTLFCGPLTMFNVLLDEWGGLNEHNLTNRMSPCEIAQKVKKFFVRYAKNRHKTVVTPPSPHLCVSSVDGKHYDMRPFLYNILWTWQFKCIDSWLLHRVSLNSRLFNNTNC